MIRKSVFDVEAKPFETPGAANVAMRLMLSEADGAPNFNLRVFDMQPGGHSPRHVHPYEHEVFILEGEGEVFVGGEQKPVKALDAVLIPPSMEHQVLNTSKALLRFICLVPQQQNEAKPSPFCCG